MVHFSVLGQKYRAYFPVFCTAEEEATEEREKKLMPNYKLNMRE